MKGVNLMRLNHNMYSLSIYKNYNRSVQQNQKTVGNISSGLKINTAGDNPSKIAQVERLKMQLLSRKAASNNLQDTSTMLQTFDGALQEMNNNMSRLKQLTIQASNGIVSDDDKETIQKEIESIKQSITDIGNNTSFNGVKLSQEKDTIKKSTIGSLDDETINIPLYNISIDSNGLNIEDIDVTKVSDSELESYFDRIDEATNKISSIRGKYGAIQSNLDGTYDATEEINDSISSAQSSLEDADIATEVLNNSNQQILIQAAISLMAQSNQLPQDALNILANTLN